MCSMGASCVINAGPDGYLAQVIMVLGYDTRRPGRTCVGGAAPGPAPNDRFWHGPVGYAHAMRSAAVQLTRDLVARYRAVDRQVVGSALVDTPAHLDRLTSHIGHPGLLRPLEPKFNTEMRPMGAHHQH